MLFPVIVAHLDISDVCVIVKMSVDARRQIVRRALKYARQQQSAKKKISDTIG